MKVWTNGNWPSAVCVAESANAASEMLNNMLAQQKLDRSAKPQDFEELDASIAQARILCDGEY